MVDGGKGERQRICEKGEHKIQSTLEYKIGWCKKINHSSVSTQKQFKLTNGSISTQKHLTQIQKKKS